MHRGYMWACISMPAVPPLHQPGLMKYFCSQCSNRGDSPSTSLALILLSSLCLFSPCPLVPLPVHLSLSLSLRLCPSPPPIVSISLPILSISLYQFTLSLYLIFLFSFSLLGLCHSPSSPCLSLHHSRLSTVRYHIIFY